MKSPSPRRARASAVALSAAATLAIASTLLARAQEPAPDRNRSQGKASPAYAGPSDRGFLLPNGWTISPVGDQVEITDLPLNITPLADGRHALVASSGFNPHNLVLVDLLDKKVVATENVRQSWFGLAVDEPGGKVWWSGGGGNFVHTFRLDGSKLARTSPAEPAPTPRVKKAQAKDKAKIEPKVKTEGPRHFRSGLALDRARGVVYSLDIDSGTVTAVPASDTGGAVTGDGAKTAHVGVRPYDVALDRHGRRLYVSDWAARAVLAVDPVELRVVARIPVGEHPNQIAAHPKDSRLFVACASSNCVSVIDTARGVVVETIATALFPRAPEGSTPDALAVSPDGGTLYVANADNNCVAVVDVSREGRSQVKGFVPTGWYPTAVAVTPDGKYLLVGVGKGNRTKPNPPNGEFRKKLDDHLAKEKLDLPKETLTELRKFPYIGTTLSGALSVVPVPDDAKLAAYTETVYKNCPYSDKLLTDATPTGPGAKTAIPTKVGDPSPIKHVIYIIKENRTYDQVFGDIGRGNGDPSLVMFGEKVTPNHHKLAREFVLLDNLYCNGHVSADGHPWSTMAYNTDYIARNWALTYSRRAGVSDDDDDDLSNAPSGYLWDACARAGLSYRSYGEYGKRVSQPDGSSRMEGKVPGLVGHTCPEFGIGTNNANQRDPDKAEVFLREFRRYEQEGDLPRFIVMSLGEDHTTGTTPGTFTPEACVASNDLALGRIIEAVSKSKLWPETAIFVIEDDAQNGPDHVDAHRTVGLVISPYAKRGSLDSTQYGTVSMIRTMELILGLPPLSQYDAAATPMFASFTDEAVTTPYTHEPARIDLEARNSALAYGAERSRLMDFTEYDKVDDFELNEILWHAVKGKDAPLPPAVRRAIAYRVAPRTP
jgi:YVTN family beta-propeller protein